MCFLENRLGGMYCGCQSTKRIHTWRKKWRWKGSRNKPSENSHRTHCVFYSFYRTVSSYFFNQYNIRKIKWALLDTLIIRFIKIWENCGKFWSRKKKLLTILSIKRKNLWRWGNPAEVRAFTCFHSFFCSSAGLSSDTGLPELKTRCSLGCVPTRGPRRECFLEFFSYN